MLLPSLTTRMRPACSTTNSRRRSPRRRGHVDGCVEGPDLHELEALAARRRARRRVVRRQLVAAAAPGQGEHQGHEEREPGHAVHDTAGQRAGVTGYCGSTDVPPARTRCWSSLLSSQPRWPSAPITAVTASGHQLLARRPSPSRRATSSSGATRAGQPQRRVRRTGRSRPPAHATRTWARAPSRRRAPTPTTARSTRAPGMTGTVVVAGPGRRPRPRPPPPARRRRPAHRPTPPPTTPTPTPSATPAPSARGRRC